jgi:hypothetical protein
VTFVLVAVLASCAPNDANFTPIPLSASPSNLTFSAPGVTQAVTLSDPGFRGTYTVEGCAGIVTLGAVANGMLSVTSAAAGTCMLTISNRATSTTVSVGVTAVHGPEI